MKAWQLLIVGLMVFLTVISAASAAISNPYAHWNLDVLTDTVSSYSLNNLGTNATSNYPDYAVSGDSSPDSSYWSGGDILNHTDDDTFDFAGDMSISFWVKPDNSNAGSYGTGHEYWLSKHDTAAPTGYAIFRHTDNRVFFQAAMSGYGWAGCSALIASFTDTTWQHIGVVFDDSANWCAIFKNGALVNNDTTDVTGTISNSARDLSLGYDVNSKQLKFEGALDEVIFYSRALSHTDMKELYDTGYSPPAPGGNTSVQFSVAFPNNNSHWASTFRQNSSVKFHNADQHGLNCTSHVIDANGSDSQEWSNTTIWANTSIDTTASHAGYDVDGTVNYWLECFNGSATFVSNNYTFVRDTVNPLITVESDNFFLAANTTLVNPLQEGDLYQLNISLNDTYLWGFNLTIETEAGADYYSNQSTNLTSTKENITNILNLSTWPGASTQYNVSLTVEDDHTALQIPPYTYAIGNQEINYTTEHNNVIRIEAVEGNLNSINTTKLLDRYTFGLTWQSARVEHQINLFCSGTLYHRTMYEYPTFVCHNGQGGNWIDFIPEGLTMSDFEDIAVKKLPSGAYNINFKTWENVQTLDFNSLGGLNHRNLSATFTLSRIPEIAQNLTKDAEGPDWLYFSWDLPGTASGGTLRYANGTLIFNSTNVTVYNLTGLTPNTQYTVNVTTFYNDTGSYTYNLSPVVSVAATTENNGSLNLEIRDERTNAIIVNNTVSVSLIRQAQNLTGSTLTGLLTLTNITDGTYTIRTIADGYGLRDMYVNINTSGTGAQEVLEGEDNVTNYLIYLINDTDRNGGVVKIKDTTGQDVEGTIVKLARYYSECNCYRAVQMATTNEYGQAVLDAEPYDGFYKFFVEHNNITEFISSQPEAFYPQVSGLWTRTITINLNNDFYESYQLIDNIGASFVITRNNATNTTTHSWSWNDASGTVTQGCYYAWHLDGVNWEDYVIKCSTGATGSIVAVLNDTGAELYRYRAFVHFGTTFSNATGASGYTEKDVLYNFGLLGSFLGAFLLGGLVLLFSYSATAVLVITVVGSTFLSLIGLLPFGLAFLTGFGFMVVGIIVYLMRS